MKFNNHTALIFLTVFILFSCSGGHEKKISEINLRQSTETDGVSNQKGGKNHVDLPLKPSTVLLTAFPEHRLVPVYKQKFSKDGKRIYIDGNYYHEMYHEHDGEYGNDWNYHYMPGFEAVYGFNMYNIAHYNIPGKEKNYFFDNPVLVKTLYFPSFLRDTLYHAPVTRNYYMVSVYDEDSNNDSIINAQDLRRFYHFDLNVKQKTLLIPLNYSVSASEYDPQNDVMYIFARLDENANGRRDKNEPVHVFLLDLKSPVMAERLF